MTLVSDLGGTSHAADRRSRPARLHADKDAELFFTEIGPGSAITGVLVHDIPTKATLAELELPDSLLSGGVTVQLR
ncbi:hypothetical protein [Micromonospora sp. HM5-17]|uniref:hypothetical protein n=1 Tax=Micromonospora sp. HM5-17 TaxID=2487710 RepID=UPI000F497F6F|nr:hypothetical protein [Micromonospora sp. HM5-17]ROT31683.1 hypothetical protein EF879_14870 [Micromonospora sp. HM5-17]